MTTSKLKVNMNTKLISKLQKKKNSRNKSKLAENGEQ